TSRVALFSLLGIVAVLLLAVIVVLSIDLGQYKSSVEELVSDAVGREFRIDGAFEPTLGRSIRLVAEEIRLSSTEWSAASNLVFVDRLDVSIDSWSLIRGPIIVETLRISGTKINLEELEDGRNNWTLKSQQTSDEEADGIADERFEELPVILNELQVNDFELNLLSPALRRPLNLSLEKFEEAILESGDMQLDISGEVNEKPVAVSAVAGKVENLVALQGIALRLEGVLGEISFQGNATIDDLLSPRRPTGQLLLQGPNAEYLTEILGLDPITTGPLSLDTSMTPAAERMNIAARGVFGEFTLDVGGSLVSLDNWSDMDIRATASGPDAATIGRLVGNDTVPQDPFRIDAVARIAGRNIQIENIDVQIGETRFDANGQFANFPRPGGASLTLSIKGPDFGRFNRLFGMPGKLTGPFELEAKLAQLPGGNGSLQLAASARDVGFTIDGILVDEPDFIGSTLNVSLNGPEFDVLAQAAGMAKSPSVDFEARISAEKTVSGLRLSNSSARIGKDRLSLSGLVGNDPLMRDTDLSFEATGPNLKGSLAAFGVETGRLRPGPWSAKGRVFRQEGQFVADELQAVIGANREYLLSANGRVTDDPKRVGSVGKVTFNGSSLAALAEAAGVSGMPDAQFRVSADVERVGDGNRISNATFQLGKDTAEIAGLIGDPPELRNTDIRFKLSAADLRATLDSFNVPGDKVPPGRLSAAGQVRYSGDSIALQNFTANLAGTDLKASGKVGALPSFDGTDIDISLAGDNLATILPPGGEFEASADAFSVRSRLQLSNNLLTVGNLEGRLGDARLTGDVSTSFEPFLSKGSWSLQASSPDFLRFVTAIEELMGGVKVPMTFRGSGNWDDNYWRFQELLLTLAKGRLSVTGALDGPPNFENTDLLVDLYIDNVSQLSALAGHQLPRESVTLHGQLTGTSDEMTLTDFGATLGESDIDGKFLLKDKEVPEASLTIVSNRLDLSGYLPPPEEPAPVPAGKAPPARTRVIPDTPIPMDKLRMLDADVDIRFGELKLRQRPMKDVRLVGSLKAGELKVSDFSLASERGGSLSGGFRLRPDGPGAELLVRINGGNLIIGLKANTPEEVEALPKYDVDFVLHGKGATVAEVAGSLNGYTRLVTGPGRTRAGAARIFTQDVVFELLNTLNPFAR
ncbi:MAG TPA: AsmA family protein, partial [Woeseiaceae bacterium]|nr:AsmA family protein [Woeseiaceae bacterium]